MTKRIRRQTVHSLDEVPKSFSSENEEREWWATHDLSEELYDKLQAPARDLKRFLGRKFKKKRAV
jgi:hypothetical protein